MDNLSLIDWGALAANSLWIVGLGLALAVLSFAGFEARVSRIHLGTILKQPRFDITLNLAGILFCSGLAANTDQLFERILWIILAVLFFLSILLGFRKRHIE
ncbi:MAG TPA: hypothetical protein VKF38_03340 [Anaerolineaceae bacterium]|nr:hypothetical protein [Anaerolineaceae bacterium]